jgi:hypothetical protein
LCRADVELDRELKPERLMHLYVSSPAQPVSETPNLEDKVSERFRAPSGTTVSVRTPVAKAAMVYLGEVWPQAIAFNSLLSLAQQRLDPNWIPVQDAERLAHDTYSLADMLLQFYSVDMVELHAGKPPFTIQVSDRPVAHPLVRLLGKRGLDITNCRHEVVALREDLSRHLVPLLDGTRDRAALLDELLQLVRDGTLVVNVPAEDEAAAGEPVEARLTADDERTRELLGRGLDRALERMARAALLVG